MRFIFFVTVHIGGMLAYAALAFTFWQNRSSHVSALLAWMFAAISIGWFLELVAQTYGYEVKPQYTMGFTIAWWTARTLKAVAPVWLLLWMNWRKA